MAAEGSKRCEGLTGGEAIAWDTYNGVIRLDSVLTPPPPAGPRYGHPGAIALTFTHPADWTPFEDNTSLHQFGVNLIRNDQQAAWRDFRKSHSFVNVSARAARDNEIEILLDFLGQAGTQVQTVCERESSFSSNGFVFSSSKIFLRTATHTALIDINVIFNPSLGNSNVNTKTLLAPTAEFGARAIDTFLRHTHVSALGLLAERVIRRRVPPGGCSRCAAPCLPVPAPKWTRSQSSRFRPA